MKGPRRTAPEIIGFHFSMDIRDVTDGRYQPSRYYTPSVYVVGDDYYAAPADNRMPRHEVGQPWEFVASYYGRSIYRSKMGLVK